MAENILQKIIDNRIKEIEKQKTLLSREKLQDQINQNKIKDTSNIKYYDFKKKILDNIKNGKISIIGEIKKLVHLLELLLKIITHKILQKFIRVKILHVYRC